MVKKGESITALLSETYRVLEYLLLQTAATDEPTRLNAVDMLGEFGIGLARVIKTLEQRLQDVSFLVRMQSAKSIIKLGRTSESACYVLAQGLSKETVTMRAVSIATLRTAGFIDAKFITALVDIALSGDYSVATVLIPSVYRFIDFHRRLSSPWRICELPQTTML